MISLISTVQWSRNWGNISEGGPPPPPPNNPCVCILPIFIILYQTFFVKVWFKLLKYNLHKRIIMVTKFNNQSHTHNLYWWSPQHVIAFYSTAVICTNNILQNNTVTNVYGCMSVIIKQTDWS